MEKGVPVRSISRCLAMLQFINRKGPSSMMEIARAVDLPYPTTIRIVQTLLHEGMLECEPVRKLYRVTSMVQTLSIGVHEQADLLKASRPHLNALTYKHGWPVSIVSASGPCMMLRDSTYSMTSRAFNNYYPGYTFPMLDCAAGHIHLAFVDDETRECLLNGMEANAKTQVVMDMFKSGVLTRRLRSMGYATQDRSQSTLNPGKTSSISFPILDSGYVAGVLTLSFFVSTMPMVDAVRLFVDDLRTSAREISGALEALRRPAGNPESLADSRPAHAAGKSLLMAA